MGTNYSKKFVKCIESNDEDAAIRIIGELSDHEIRSSFEMVMERKMLRLLERLIDRCRPTAAVVKKCTDVQCMQLLSKRGFEYDRVEISKKFANPDMFRIYAERDVHRYLESAFLDGDPAYVELCTEYYKKADLHVLPERREYAWTSQFKTFLSGILSERIDDNTRLLFNTMKSLQNIQQFIDSKFVNYKLIHDGQTLLISALINNYPNTALRTVPLVDLSVEYKGRNALHYAKGNKSVTLAILDLYVPPNWDMYHVVADLDTMRKFVERYKFKRETYLRIFSAMAALPNMDDDDLRCFYELSSRYIATDDIPDLLHLVGKYPLTRDKLRSVIRPSLIEADIATLKRLNNVPEASAPPAYHLDV